MNIVAVTACPTGIAHTYMAAEQLEKAAKKFGHSIKVETQGSMGIENELSQSDVDAAELCIFAVGIPVRNKERFDKIKILEVGVQEAIKKPDAIFEKLGQSARSTMSHDIAIPSFPLKNGLHARPASRVPGPREPVRIVRHPGERRVACNRKRQEHARTCRHHDEGRGQMRRPH